MIKKTIRNVKKVTAAVLAAVLLVGSAAAVLPGATIEAEAATSAFAATISMAIIQGSNVLVKATAPTPLMSDDGIYHLYAQDTYEFGAMGKEVATAPVGKNIAFQFPLNKNTANSNLFKKFVIVAYVGGVPTAISNAQYITNPEATATHTVNRHDGGGKKGALLDAHLANSPDYLRELGIDQITYNLPIGNLLKNGNMRYTYNGKTYYFNSGIVGQYDFLVPKMNSLGISVTLILLNNYTGNLSNLHPFSRNFLGANYYAFNVADPVGVETLEAVASFLGERYSGTGHGTVDNWIVGNEVNARQEWNYIDPALGVGGAAAEYAKAVRIFYNGIKAQNANARVYVSLDHEWARSDNEAFHYGAKPFMEFFNAYVISEGNFDYGIAVHPYNVPLYSAQTWMPSFMDSVNQTPNTMYVTMMNINILTDFFCQKENLSPNGQVRSILCSELGYTSIPFGGYVSDENQQAAAVALGYLQAMHNQHIDGFFMRETDSPEEIRNDGLAVGLLTTDDYHNYRRKMAFHMYRYLDDPSQQANYIALASAFIGIDVNLLLTPR